MRKLVLLALVALPSVLLAGPVEDTRKILAGTVTTLSVKNEYLSGKRDGTTVFKGALGVVKGLYYKTCSDGSTVLLSAACPVPPVVTPPPPPPPVTWTKCADEGQTCTIMGTAQVRYGVEGFWSAPKTVTGSVVCSNAVFGDPKPNVVKQCQTTGMVHNPPPVVTPPPPPVVTPPPPPPPSTGGSDVVAPTPAGAPSIADNFDTSLGIFATGRPPALKGDPSNPDPGAFRFDCSAGHLGYNDPLVYPGRAGASHLHQFFGNTLTDHNSNSRSLRTTGGTTCGDSAAPINRSAYWVPALIHKPTGTVKKFWRGLVYYKRKASVLDDGVTPNPRCTWGVGSDYVGNCVGLPTGLRFIFGYDMATDSHGPTDNRYIEHWKIGFSCSTGGSGKTFAQANCPAGSTVAITMAAPSCWDGVNLDSPNHRSHLHYGRGIHDDDQCPSTHKYKIPVLSITLAYYLDRPLVEYAFSSDIQMGKEGGYTAHMDYWEGWSPTVKDTWNEKVSRRISLGSGDLGNGTAIKGMGEIIFGPSTNPPNVPVPPLP